MHFCHDVGGDIHHLGLCPIVNVIHCVECCADACVRIAEPIQSCAYAILLASVSLVRSTLAAK